MHISFESGENFLKELLIKVSGLDPVTAGFWYIAALSRISVNRGSYYHSTGTVQDNIGMLKD
jgi:hypothetical protein